MADILHKVGIRTSSPDLAYRVLTTIEGLSGWWTNDTQGQAKVGGVLKFQFGAGGFDMKVLELDPAERVLWQVIDEPEEWIDTRIAFDLRQEGDWTIIFFKTPGLERASTVHAPLQNQVGRLPAEPEGTSRNRERNSLAKRN